jgi:hypothetical protein
MHRHSTDLVGLIFGTAFAIAGVGFLVNEATDTVVNPAWATGLGLMLLGAVALIATLVRGRRDRDHFHDHEFFQPETIAAEAATSGAVTSDAVTSDE